MTLRTRLRILIIATIIIEVAWVVTMSAIMFGLLKAANIFRVPPEDEDIGLDNSKHGGSAYTHDMQMTPNEMSAYNVAMTDGSKAEASPRI